MKYDAVIIGGGPGGYETALRIAKLDGKAALVERRHFGGVCTNVGCIPTKTLIASCEVLDDIRRSSEFGIDVPQHALNHQALFKRRDRVVLTMRKGVEKLLQDAKVDVYRGEAKLTSKNTVEVNGIRIEANNIVVASGSQPAPLPGVPIDHEYVLSGDDAASSTNIPANIVIIGGGIIGCEYASIYSRLGSKVTLVEALPRILPTEDEDVSYALHKSLSNDMRIITGTKVGSVDKTTKTVKVASENIPADVVILAVGRKPNLPQGLSELGVATDRNGIKVDARMRTNIENIYAVGDVTDGIKLAHVAYAGAEVAAQNIICEDTEADFSCIPWCIFTHPEVARVGVSEREANVKIRVGRAEYVGNGKARAMGERDGFCKVIVDDENDTILGAHIVGSHASSLIGEAALAVKYKMHAHQVTETIHPHPTLTELFKQACENAEK